MSWIKACLHHRLAIYLCALALCIAGLVSLYVMPIAPFPLPTSNNLRVNFSYPGANASTVQTQVTTKVAYALQGVPNIQSMRATSRDGAALIELTLVSSTPEALLQTQMRIMQAIAASHLPTAVPQPRITQIGGTSGLITYLLTSRKLSLFQIDNYIKAQLLPEFSSIPGVSTMSNDQQPTLHISLIPQKLALYHLNPITIANTLNAAFKAQPLGKLYIKQQPYLLSLGNQLSSIPNFSQLIIGQSRGTDPHASHESQALMDALPLRLGDVAQLNFAPREPIQNYFSSYNGQVADSIELYTRSQANPFQVAKLTHARVNALSHHLPEDLSIHSAYDMTQVMHASFREVALTIAIASCLVLLIALIFLGHLRTTLVPIVTIPICLLSALIVVNSLGYSLNILTLLAMVIAVGLVVDDAIVVVENMTRHVEAGMPKHAAIIHGSADIAITIIGITATLLAVYLPVVFFSGSAFIFFLKAFAVPLAAAVFISGVVALTLTPVMCSQLLLAGEENRFQQWFNACLARIIAVYQGLLKFCLRWRYVTLCAVVVIVAIGVVADLHLPQKFFPDDPGGDVQIKLTAKAGDSIATLRDKMAEFNSFYTAPTVDFYSVDIRTDDISGQLTGRLDIQYKDAYLHQLPAFGRQISQFIKQQQMKNTQVRVTSFSNAGGDSDIVLTLYANQGISAVNAAATHLTDLLRKSTLFSHVDNTMQLPRKQFAFDIDMVKAARLGITRQQITQLLSTLYGGYQLDNAFDIAGLTVPVLVRLDTPSLQNTQSLQLLQITNAAGKTYPLSEFVSLQMVAKAAVLTSFNGEPSVDLQFNLAAGVSLKEAIPYLDAQLAAHAPAMAYQYQGAAKDFLTAGHQTLLIGVLGILCIYFLLALLFRSLLDPFIILLTVPFSVVFGAASLHIIHGSLNLYSTLSLITLVGLITKHGILIVQFANHEMHRGASVREALLTSTHDRFRPIIMTTLAMTFGALPLLLSSGAMYVARQDLAIVLMGGLIIGTFFSLFVVPLVYSLLKREPAKPIGAPTAQ